MFVSWYNGSLPLLDSPDHTIRHQSVLQEDGTYLTSSYINIRTTRHHHGMLVRCLATNEVLESEGERPQEDSHTLSVKFAPVMTAVEPLVTVNISSKVRPPHSDKPDSQNSNWYFSRKSGKGVGILARGKLGEICKRFG